MTDVIGRRSRLVGLTRICWILVLGAATAAAADWPQFGHDAAHSGTNPAETTLDAGNVAHLAPVYAGGIRLPAIVDGAPVFLGAGADDPGGHPWLFVLGGDNPHDGRTTRWTLFAIDAATGKIVWSKTTTGGSGHASSSPAIDPGRQFVYAAGLDGRVHKYHIADGAEATAGDWPLRVSRKPDVEKIASGLTFATAGGVARLYAVTDGYFGDGGDYQGHVVTVDLATGARSVFNAMCANLTVEFGAGDCSGRMGGIWGRGGATFDAATGRVYVATGNGAFDADRGGHDYGDSVLALNPDGTGAHGGPLDSYTPAEHERLRDTDADLGSVSPMVLAAPAGSSVRHPGLIVGKDGVLRLLNLDDLSGAGGPGHVGGELQRLPLPQGACRMHHQPAVWQDPSGRTFVFAGNDCGLAAFTLALDSASRPELRAAWRVPQAASSPVVAAGLVYTFGASAQGGGERLVARDATSGKELWASPPLGPRHWQSPIIADGVVTVVDGTSTLWAFGPPKSS